LVASRKRLAVDAANYDISFAGRAIRSRMLFWRGTAVCGWHWIRGVTDSLGRLILMLAFAGLPGVAVRLSTHDWSWTVGTAVLVTIILALAEGAFQEWDAARRAALPSDDIHMAIGYLRAVTASDGQTAYDRFLSLAEGLSAERYDWFMPALPGWVTAAIQTAGVVERTAVTVSRPAGAVVYRKKLSEVGRKVLLRASIST
jgi:hypothetical protein